MQIELDGRWGIGGKIHGGYLLRHLAATVVTEEHPHPLAVSAHFLRAPDPGTTDVKVDVLRVGRRVTQSRASLSQGDLCVEALITTGRLDPDANPFWSDSTPPALPPVEECTHMIPDPWGPDFRVGHLDFVDLRCDPSTVTFASRVPGPDGRIAGWAQMPTEGPGEDLLGLLVLADVMPPVTFDLGVPGWVPTIELTAYVRAFPAPGPLMVEQQARLLEDGWLDEECAIWDSRGRLVCQARQLAGYRTQRAG
jgi:hypothetical protein